MFPNRHDISIQEVSFEEYCRLKTLQKIKPPFEEKNGNIYGEILNGVSYSAGNIAREVSNIVQKEGQKEIRRINALILTTEGAKVWQKRKTIYLASEEGRIISQNEETLSKLEQAIVAGRGLDIIFQGVDVEKRERNIKKSPEKHFYRLFGGNLVLVQVQIPYEVLSQGKYQFRRTTQEEYHTLKATNMMPQQEIKAQFLQRRHS